MSFWDGAGHFLSNFVDPASYLKRGIEGGNWDPTSSQFSASANDPVAATTESGGVLDTTQADEDRARQMAIIAQLQQQAMNGDPVALAQLQQATAKTVAGQSALGQTSAAQHGTDPSTAMRNILGGQAHAQQVGVNQADTLKALSQQQAQQQLAGILGGVRGQDIGQAAGQQAAQVGMTEGNAAAAQARTDQSNKVGQSLLSTIPVVGGTLSSAGKKSKGGHIDGRALVPGDSEANDIVPAMLSPGEIVIPRSHAGSPEAAAAFVAALQAHKHVQHFATGGGVNGDGTEVGADIQSGTGHGFENEMSGKGKFLPGLVNTFLSAEGLGTHQTVPYTPLNTDPANNIRGQQVDLSHALTESAAGRGPSAVSGQLQAGTDQNIQDAMRASARGQNVLGVAGEQAQKLAGESAMARAGEVSDAQRGAEALNAQARGQSIQQAEVAQKAALNTTLTNMGLDAAHRLAILNTIGAAGQGLAAAGASGIFAKSAAENVGEQGGDVYDSGALDNGGQGETPFTGDTQDSDGGGYDGGGPDTSGDSSGGFAHGGQVPQYATAISRDGKPFRFACGGMAPEKVARFSGGGVARPAPTDEEIAESQRRQLAARDPGASVAPPTKEERDRDNVTWARAHPGNRNHPGYRAPGPEYKDYSIKPEDPRPPRPAHRELVAYAALAQGGEVFEMRDHRGQPMRVARSGVSPAFVQRFAEGGSVMSPEQQDALVGHLTGPQSPLASFQPQRAPLTAADWGQAAPPAPAQQALTAADWAQPGRPTFSLGNPLAAPSVSFAPVPEPAPAAPATHYERGKGMVPDVPMYRAEPSLLDRLTGQAKPQRAAEPEAPPLAVTHRAPPSVPVAPARVAPGGARGAGGGGQSFAAPPDANATRLAAETENEQGAIRAQGEAESERSRQLAEDAKARQSEALAQATREEKMNADYQSHRQAAQDKFEALTQKYSDMTVDPSRFWGTRTTGDKILAGIGLALGALGGSADGVNRSVGIINQAIDRDIDAQKANIAKAGEVAGRQGQLLGIMRANFGDDAQALAAARATMAMNAQARIAQIEAQTADPIKKTQLAQMAAQVGARAATEAQRAAAQRDQQAKMFALEQQRLGLERERVALAAGRLGAKGMSAADVPEVQDARSRYIAGGGIGGETAEIELATALAKASGGGKSTPKLVKMFRDQLEVGRHTLTANQRAARADAMLRGLSVPGVITGGGSEEGGGE